MFFAVVKRNNLEIFLVILLQKQQRQKKENAIQLSISDGYLISIKKGLSELLKNYGLIRIPMSINNKILTTICCMFSSTDIL